MDVEDYPEYPIFKGLQRPLEFAGLQGRYITWAAITIGVTILGFIIFYVTLGFLVAIVFAVLSICVGAALIILKQRRGLHSKKVDKGVYVYSHSHSL